MDLKEITGVGRKTEWRLNEAGIESVEDLAELGDDAQVPGLSVGILLELADNARAMLTALYVENEDPEEEAAKDEEGPAVSEDPEEGGKPDPEDPEPGNEESTDTVALTGANELEVIGEIVAGRPPYVKLTFRGMTGRPDVGQLDIKRYTFIKGVPQRVPQPVAEAILARPQYEFDVEEE